MKNSIGLVVNSNDFGGINKLNALIANDIAHQDCNVDIYVPIFPFYTYYVNIFNKKLYWFLKIIPFYFKKWILRKSSSLNDLIDKTKITKKYIKINFFIYKLDPLKLKRHDKIVLNGIGSVIECKDKYPQEKQIYIINQIEEIYHGEQYNDLYQSIRKNFKGKIISHCNFMKRKLSNHLDNIEIIPNPISPNIWKHKENFNIQKERRDILLYWKNNNAVKSGLKLIEGIYKKNKNLKLSIFGRSTYNDDLIKTIVNKYKCDLFLDISESNVANLYLNHNFLLYPNDFEDFGMPPVESLACGCIPILRYGIGASDMYAVNDFNSIFMSDNEEKDVDKISRLLKNNSMILELRKNSNKNLEQFSPENYGQRVLKD